MGTYTERYVYDAVGNFHQMRHRGNDPANQGWTRNYSYAEASLIIEDGKHSNRLSGTQVETALPPPPRPIRTTSTEHVPRMPHLRPPAGPSRTCTGTIGTSCGRSTRVVRVQPIYVYDASGQRVRKVWEKSPSLTEECIYLGGFKIFRRHGGPISANTSKLEREKRRTLWTTRRALRSWNMQHADAGGQ